MMKKISLILVVISSLAYAGLPPTSSKVVGDANNITTFNYQFPNFTGTHSGVTLSLGVNGTSGGGTGTTTGHSILDLALTGGTMSGTINMGGHGLSSVLDPVNAQDAATKNYVDTVASSLQPIQAVYAATIGGNITGTYLNGVAGVGATFTTSSTSTFTLDGTTPPLNSRILLKDQTSGFQNGVYNFTVLPVGGVSGSVFTRSLDYNTASSIDAGDLIPVINGTVNAQTSWLQTATVTNVGSDSLVFIEWTANPSSYLLKTNNLSDLGSSTVAYNNIAPNTSVVPGSYTLSSITVDSRGRITSAANGTGGGGASTIEARFSLTDAIVPYVNIGGTHYEQTTKTLSLVYLSMLDSGSAGVPWSYVSGHFWPGYSTVVQINQYKPGNSTVFAIGCAAIPGNGGSPNSLAATVYGCSTGGASSLNLSIGDVMTVDVKTVGPSTFSFGTPDSLTVEW